MSTDLLREAESDLAELVGLPGAIRDKVRAGLAELRRIHDAVDAEVARLTDGAKATLDKLRALGPEAAASEPAASEPAAPEAPRLDDAPPAGGGRPPLTF